MIPTLPPLVLALFALQDPAVVTRDVKGPEWRDLDRVVAIVNQDIITLRELLRDFNRRYNAQNPIDKSEVQSAQTRILTDHVKSLLSTQAGQDMGADPKAVERTVQDWFDRTVSNSNGVVGLSRKLQAQDLSTQDLKRQAREQIYSTTWSDSVTGEGTGVALRPSRDRYVRPGQIRYLYEETLRHPESLRSIGGSNEMFTLQVLVLDPLKHGGAEKTLELAREIKAAIEGGTDMSELVRRHSMSTTNDGIGEPADLARIKLLFPATAEFVARRPSDDKLATYVSDPLLLSEPGGRTLYQLARIVLRTDGFTPPLASATVQTALTTRARDELDAFRLDRAFGGLHRAAYIWPPEYSAQPPR